mgnify:FL=1
MSVWGIGAYFDKDVSDEFIANNHAGIGWAKNDAPALYEIVKKIQRGDLIYIKSLSQTKKQLHIKAVGIVKDLKMEKDYPIVVSWKKLDNKIVEITPEMYRNNVFNNALYEELNVEIIDYVIEQILAFEEQ